MASDTKKLLSALSGKSERESRIEELLKVIGGAEISARAALAQEDMHWHNIMRMKQNDALKRLKRVSHGLPEEEPDTDAED